ncbi:MAG: hypothetical protein KAV25_00540 [Methanophagales archaeon]|nr:hypothetical protein [Methanophagales archaeon]
MTGEDFEMGGDSSRDVYMKYFRYTSKLEGYAKYWGYTKGRRNAIVKSMEIR